MPAESSDASVDCFGQPVARASAGTSGWYARPMAKTPYDTDLDRNPANFQPLTPLTFLERAASVFPDAYRDHPRQARRNYAEFYARARKLASALAKRGIKRGDTVVGDARQHAGHARMPLRRADDAARAQHAQHAARRRDHRLLARPCRGQGADHRPRILQGDEGGAGAGESEAAGDRLRRSGIFRPRRAARRDRIRGLHRRGRSGLRLEDAGRRMGRDLAQLHLAARPAIPRASSITTAAPICSRSAISSPARMAKHPVYLWTLPMFHCNGWCFPWSISVVAGTHVCLRQVRAPAMYDAIAEPQGHASVRRADRDGDVAQRAGDEKKPLPHVVQFFTAAAPPPEAVLAAMKEAGFNVTHLYGLTEATARRWSTTGTREWDALPAGRAGREEGPPGRALRRAGSARRDGSRRRCSRCRATARRWAK